MRPGVGFCARGRTARYPAYSEASRNGSESSRRLIHTSGGAKAAVDSRSGASRAKTAFRGWSSARSAKASLIRRAATACAQGAGYAFGLGCPCAQVAVCRGRAGYCSAFRGEQGGDGEGSPERRGKQIGSAAGIRCLSAKARRTKFHLFKSRCHHYPSGGV